jgi:peptide/nickel transport system ATP-binding protein
MKTPLVRAIGISKTFDVSAPWLNRVIERKPKLLLKAVSDVSFDIHAGETLALVGESGCGKSTIARLLVGLYKTSTGSIEFDSKPLLQLETDPVLRQRVQMIFQDPYASLNPRWKVVDIIAEPLRVHKLCLEGEVRSRVEGLLSQVGLAGADADKFPHQFSGGQRQRLSIARALASEPEFLVCDEPTSALDVSVQAQVLNLMRDLQKQKGLTYLFISHNLAVVHHVSDRVGVMYLGRIVELADKDSLFSNPRHPYTRMLLDAIPDIAMSGKARTPVSGEVPNPLTPPSGCTFHPRCALANERCRTEIPQLLTTEIHDARATFMTQVACHAVQEKRV